MSKNRVPYLSAMLFFRFYAALTGLLHGNRCFFARRSPFFGNPIMKYTKIDTGLQPGHQYLNIKQYVPRLFASFPRILFAAVALFIHLLIQMHINRNRHFSFSHETFIYELHHLCLPRNIHWRKWILHPGRPSYQPHT